MCQSIQWAQILLKYRCFFIAEDLFQLEITGLHDAAERAEGFDEFLSGRRADGRYVVQHAGSLAFDLEDRVIGDCETVGFVSDSLQQLDEVRAMRQIYEDKIIGFGRETAQAM